jgi:hypothetical protein
MGRNSYLIVLANTENWRKLPLNRTSTSKTGAQYGKKHPNIGNSSKPPANTGHFTCSPLTDKLSRKVWWHLAHYVVLVMRR